MVDLRMLIPPKLAPSMPRPFAPHLLALSPFPPLASSRYFLDDDDNPCVEPDPEAELDLTIPELSGARPEGEHVSAMMAASWTAARTKAGFCSMTTWSVKVNIVGVRACVEGPQAPYPLAPHAFITCCLHASHARRFN